MTNVVHLRDYTKHKPDLDPKQEHPASVIVLPMLKTPASLSEAQTAHNEHMNARYSDPESA